VFDLSLPLAALTRHILGPNPSEEEEEECSVLTAEIRRVQRIPFIGALYR